MTDSRFVEINGLRTFYVHEGRGPAVLLIHGAGPGACSQINWKHNIGPLAAAGFSVVAYDQPGFGHSDNPPEYSMEYRVAHAKAFLTAMHLQGASLVGNSMGAYIAARLALDDDRVGRLVLVASSTLAPQGSARAAAAAREHAQELREFAPTRESIRALTLKTVVDAGLVTDSVVEERLAMSLGTRLEAHERRRTVGPPRPIVGDLQRLKSKTLILWGKDDRAAVVERAFLLLGTIPGAELHVFDRCGHWVQWDQAARFNALVADFLRG